MMAIVYQTYLVDDILQKVDRATMAFSLEGREPFLDHTLIEFVAQLPDELKYHKGKKIPSQRDRSPVCSKSNDGSPKNGVCHSDWKMVEE